MNSRAGCGAGVALLLLLAVRTTEAQTSEPPLSAVEATPVGALPPLALPMPAARDQSYWGVRVQAAQRFRGDAHLRAVAGGIDFQWEGGSVFGATAGYLARDCPAGVVCDDHWLFGMRARLNLLTGGPTLARLIGDNSANTTLGAELGWGIAPGAAADGDACTVDLGVPLSIAMFQRVRVVAFATPGVAWDVECTNPVSTRRTTYFTGLGIALQQVGMRGLDIHFGGQKIYRSGTGYQLGISVAYVRLP
jgi:hypothetical protein